MESPLHATRAVEGSKGYPVSREWTNERKKRKESGDPHARYREKRDELMWLNGAGLEWVAEPVSG